MLLFVIKTVAETRAGYGTRQTASVAVLSSLSSPAPQGFSLTRSPPAPVSLSWTWTTPLSLLRRGTHPASRKTLKTHIVMKITLN